MDLPAGAAELAAKINTTFALVLKIGEKKASAAPIELMQALATAEVTCGDECPLGFQLSFRAARGPDDEDYSLMDHDLLQVFNRVTLEVATNAESKVLIDGYVTNKELDVGSSRIVLTGEDLSLRMDMFEAMRESPSQSDKQIVEDLLKKYNTLDFTPKVVDPPAEYTRKNGTPTKLKSDRDCLLDLASYYGYVFYLKFGQKSGSKSTAFWGPREKAELGSKQPWITANSVLFTNVDGPSFSFDALQPELKYAQKLGEGDGDAESKDIDLSAKQYKPPPMADLAPPLKEFASLGLEPQEAYKKAPQLKVKGKYIPHQHLAPGLAPGSAQAQTDRTAGRSVTLTGELDTARYGHVLDAPGKVEFRGAGNSFDGLYYVKSVKHTFNFLPGSLQYKQRFTLHREGLGEKG